MRPGQEVIRPRALLRQQNGMLSSFLVPVHGSDETFEKKYKEDAMKSNQVPPTTSLSTLNPYEMYQYAEEGRRDGLFNDLRGQDDPNGDNTCLTQRED